MGSSAIDETKPIEGNPTTASVRDNFAAAKSEIIQLQDDDAAETTRVDTQLALKAQRAGDLSGTATSTTVSRIQGRDVTNAAPTTNQTLTWDGSAWGPSDVLQLQGRPVANTAPTNGQQMRWNGTAWVPATNTVTLSGGVTGTGDASAGAIAANVEQLQGRVVSNAIPAAGQALIWSGAAWTPTSGTGSPANIVFRAMTPDLADWLSGAGEGLFASEGAPTNAPGPGDWKYIGLSNAANDRQSILAIHTQTSRILHSTNIDGVWSGWTEYASITDVPNFSERVVTNSAWSAYLLAAPTLPAGWSLQSGSGATAVYRSSGNSNWVEFSINPPIEPNDFFDINISYTEDNPDNGYGYNDFIMFEAPYDWNSDWGMGPGQHAHLNTSGVTYRYFFMQMESGFVGTVRISAFRKLVSRNSTTLRIKGMDVVSKVTGNLGIGGLTYLASGSNNLAFGTGALNNITSTSNTIAIGASAGASNVRGNSNIFIGASARQDYGVPTLQNSIIIGSSARWAGWTEGSYGNATVIGHNAYTTGSNCTVVGGGAYHGWTCSNCTTVGANAYTQSNLTNAMSLGFAAVANTSNTIVLGNNAITTLRCQVQTISVLSDVRIKEEIEPANLDMCLDAVRNLPVSRFRYKDFAGTFLDQHRTGWLADDVERVFPHSVQKSDEWFPVLDEHGEPKMTSTPAYRGEIPRAVQKASEYEKKAQSRGIEVPILPPEPEPLQPEKFLIEGVKSLNMDQALPTLWGAVQRIIQAIDDIERRMAQTHGDGQD